MHTNNCPACKNSVKQSAVFCSICGQHLDIEENTPQTSTKTNFISKPVSKKTISVKAKLIYSILALLTFAVFTYVFISYLPGNAHPVIKEQPSVSMPAMSAYGIITQQFIRPKVENGMVIISLSEVLEKNLVAFDYQSSTTTIPLIAFITSEGKLVTAIRVCEPCNSDTYRIEGNELACGNCETRWVLNTLEGLQGACQKFPPDPIPSEIFGNEVHISVQLIEQWKMRI